MTDIFHRLAMQCAFGAVAGIVHGIVFSCSSAMFRSFPEELERGRRWPERMVLYLSNVWLPLERGSRATPIERLNGETKLPANIDRA